MKHRRIEFYFLTTLALAALAGCAGMETNEALMDAQSAVQAAGRDATVVEVAAVDLERAREALERAQALAEEGGGGEQTMLEHNAYLAQRYAEIAMAQAGAARAEDDIDNAEAERNRVLLEVRTAEAERQASEATSARALAEQRATQAQSARDLAEQRAQETRTAQTAAAEARQRASELEQELSELKAQQTERGLVLTLSDVLFDTDEATLKPGAATAIDELAGFMQENPERELLIEGHTDSRGTDDYNETLAERRANAVRDALLQRGVNASRLHTHGVGESRPIATNETAAGRQLNRRVEVVVSDENGQIPGFSALRR